MALAQASANDTPAHMLESGVDGGLVGGVQVQQRAAQLLQPAHALQLAGCCVHLSSEMQFQGWNNRQASGLLRESHGQLT